MSLTNYTFDRSIIQSKEGNSFFLKQFPLVLLVFPKNMISMSLCFTKTSCRRQMLFEILLVEKLVSFLFNGVVDTF